jgi:chromosomal replication initiation ATPase DnaA
MSKFNELYMTLQPFKIDELNDIENLIAKTNKFLDCNVKERKRTNANVQGRMFLSTYLVDVIGMTTTRAGEIIGIDHSTVVHHRKTLKNLITIYPEIRDKWKNFLLYV